MRIRLKHAFSGPAGDHPVGSERDWDDEDALRLIARGHAEPVRRAPVEKALRAGASEKAVTR